MPRRGRVGLRPGVGARVTVDGRLSASDGKWLCRLPERINHQVIHNQENSTNMMGRQVHIEVFVKRAFAGCDLVAAGVCWIIVVHDENRTVRRARRKVRDQDGTVPVADGNASKLYRELQRRLGGWTIPLDQRVPVPKCLRH